MEYTTEPMDSLPSIAEAFGHSGEWQTLAEANPDLPDFHNIQPGMGIMIPAEWVQEMENPPGESPLTTSSVATTGTTTSESEEESSNGGSRHSRHSAGRAD